MIFYGLTLEVCLNGQIPFSGYGERLMEQLLYEYATNRKALLSSIDEIRANIPGTLASGMERPDKEEAVAKYKARFNKD